MTLCLRTPPSPARYVRQLAPMPIYLSTAGKPTLATHSSNPTSRNVQSQCAKRAEPWSYRAASPSPYIARTSAQDAQTNWKREDEASWSMTQRGEPRRLFSLNGTSSMPVPHQNTHLLYQQSRQRKSLLLYRLSRLRQPALLPWAQPQCRHPRLQYARPRRPRHLGQAGRGTYFPPHAQSLLDNANLSILNKLLHLVHAGGNDDRQDRPTTSLNQQPTPTSNSNKRHRLPSTPPRL